MAPGLSAGHRADSQIPGRVFAGSQLIAQRRAGADGKLAGVSHDKV